VVTALTGMLQIWVASEHTIRTAEFCRMIVRCSRQAIETKFHPVTGIVCAQCSFGVAFFSRF